MTGSERVLKNIIKGGIFILPFLPFVVTDTLFFPFITGKNFIFRIIVELLLVAWVVLVVKNRKHLPGRSAILWSVLAVFGVLLLATIFSINPYKSFWSNAERMEGLFGLAHLLALFVITTSVFKERDWMQLFGVTLVAGAGVAIHAFGQLVGWFEPHRGSRIDANFGNSTYFAIYAIFMIFFALFAAARVRVGKYVPLAETWGKILMWGLLFYSAFYAFLLYENSTRGALLGFLGGLMLAGFIVTFFSRGKARKWGSVVLVVLILIPIIFFFVKDTSVVQESPVLKRFADISTTEQTTESRLTIWSMSYEAWQDRPILGWGMGNFTTVFAQYYEPKLWKQEPWFDRSHNVLFDWLVGAGILGLLAYLSLFGTALWMLWRLRKKGALSTPEAALFVGLLGAYFVHNLFVFDNLISYILFFMVLAFLHSARDGWERAEDEEVPMVAQPFARQGVVAIVAILVLFSLYAYNIKPIKALGTILDTLQIFSVAQPAQQLGTENIRSAHERFINIIGYETFVTPEAREQLLIKAIDAQQATLADKEALSDLAEYAEEQAVAHIAQYPHDMRMRTFLASFYVQMGEPRAGEELAKELIELAPTRPLFYLILGEAHFQQDEFDEALKAFETAVQLAPDYPEAQKGYASALINSGDIAGAKKFMEETYGTAHPPLAHVVQAYMDAGLFLDATVAAENLVESDPNNVQWRFALARLYVSQRRDADAVAELLKIIELEPAVRQQMETLIGQIRDGTISRDL